MNKVKNWLVGGLCLASTIPSTLLAEGSAVTVDVSAAEGAADAIGTAVSGLITGKIMTNILLVVGAGLAVWGLFLVVKYVRRGAK